MSRKHDIKFKNWEAKKRIKIGDLIFLNKYIKLFKSINTTNKITFILSPILSSLVTIQFFISFIASKQIGYLLIVMFSFLLTISLCVVCVFYIRFVEYEVYDKHIQRWQSELSNIHNSTADAILIEKDKLSK